MKTVTELVAELNAAKLDTPTEAEDLLPEDAVEVKTLGIAEHRWYTTGTVVYRVGTEFIGIWGPTSLKSEMTGFLDLGIECEAFEMVEVPSVTYKRKKQETQ